MSVKIEREESNLYIFTNGVGFTEPTPLFECKSLFVKNKKKFENP